MQTWQAVILLTAAQQGLHPDAIEPLFPMLEARSKKILKQIGSTDKEIIAEYPDHILQKALDLMRSDPEAYDRELQKASFLCHSRN